MKKISQQDFEANKLCKDANFAMINGLYVNPRVQLMWLGWQASRAALKSENCEDLKVGPVAWVKETELTDLRSCNGRSIWAESPDIWFDEVPEHLVPVFKHPYVLLNSDQTQAASNPKSKTIDNSKWVNDLKMKPVFGNYDDSETPKVAIPTQEPFSWANRHGEPISCLTKQRYKGEYTGHDIPLYVALPEVETLKKERDELNAHVKILQNNNLERCARFEEITKERDYIANRYKEREEEAHQLSERIIKLLAERDALYGTVIAYKMVRDNITERLNIVNAAAKLALVALQNMPLDKNVWHVSKIEMRQEAIDALNKEFNKVGLTQ